MDKCDDIFFGQSWQFSWSVWHCVDCKKLRSYLVYVSVVRHSSTPGPLFWPSSFSMHDVPRSENTVPSSIHWKWTWKIVRKLRGPNFSEFLRVSETCIHFPYLSASALTHLTAGNRSFFLVLKNGQPIQSSLTWFNIVEHNVLKPWGIAYLDLKSENCLIDQQVTFHGVSIVWSLQWSVVMELEALGTAINKHHHKSTGIPTNSNANARGDGNPTAGLLEDHRLRNRPSHHQHPLWPAEGAMTRQCLKKSHFQGAGWCSYDT